MGEPKPKPPARVRSDGHHTWSYLPKGFQSYYRESIKAIREQFQKQYQKEPITEPVRVLFCFYRKTKRKVDLSNLEKAIEDILVKAGVLEDDSQILAKESYLYKGAETPRTVIEIEPCGEFFPLFQ